MKTQLRLVVATIAVATIGTVLSAVLSVSAANANSRTDKFERLIEKSKIAGPLSVIVQLDIPWESTDITSRAQAHIRTAQEALFRQLGKSSALPGTIRYKYTPEVRILADEPLIRRLAELRIVRNIIEDKIYQLFLDSAVKDPEVGVQIAWGTGTWGNGQYVAILDTGIDLDHPFLVDKVQAQACFSSSGITGTTDEYGDFGGEIHWETEGHCTDSETFIGSPGETGPGMPCNHHWACGHGTMMAGVVAGKSSDCLTNTCGVAYDANLISVNVFNKTKYFVKLEDGTRYDLGTEAEATASDIKRGLEWVIDLSIGNTKFSGSIAAVNLSLGTDEVYDTEDACLRSEDAIVMRNTFETLMNQGIAIVAATGNQRRTTGIAYPACDYRTISVGGVDDNDGMYELGPEEGTNSPSLAGNVKLWFLAPAVDITSSWPDEPSFPDSDVVSLLNIGEGTAELPGVEATASGTSNSAAFLSATVALIRQVRPDYPVSYIRWVLNQTGATLTDPKSSVSAARVNVGAAVAIALTESMAANPWEDATSTRLWADNYFLADCLQNPNYYTDSYCVDPDKDDVGTPVVGASMDLLYDCIYDRMIPNYELGGACDEHLSQKCEQAKRLAYASCGSHTGVLSYEGKSHHYVTAACGDEIGGFVKVGFELFPDVGQMFVTLMDDPGILIFAAELSILSLEVARFMESLWRGIEAMAFLGAIAGACNGDDSGFDLLGWLGAIGGCAGDSGCGSCGGSGCGPDCSPDINLGCAPNCSGASTVPVQSLTSRAVRGLLVLNVLLVPPLIWLAWRRRLLKNTRQKQHGKEGGEQ